MVSIDAVGLCYVRVQSARVLSDSAVKHIRENYSFSPAGMDNSEDK